MLRVVSVIMSTITSQWQVTIPQDVRKEMALKVGQQIVWEVEGGKLAGRRIRSVGELSGCFKQDTSATRREDCAQAFANAAVARHERICRVIRA
jgi:bifunctional DNA-binding transcriptional regulator/antitoxin component of YhaV-PrlF toxin-antitoxin module